MIRSLNATPTLQAHPVLESESFAGEWQSLQLRRTELIAQHRELIEARDVYAEIYDSASEPLLTLARSGAIRTANLATAELLGRERTGLVGRQLWSFVHRADRAALGRALLDPPVELEKTANLRVTTRRGLTSCRLHLRWSKLIPKVAHVMLLTVPAAIPVLVPNPW